MVSYNEISNLFMSKIYQFYILGKTYFFKGKGFWKFNDLRMSVEKQEQTPSGPFWMGCPKTLEGPRTKEKYIETNSPYSSTSVNTPKVASQLLLLAIFIHFWYLIT